MEKKKQTLEVCLVYGLLELSEVGTRTPQTSPRRCLHPFSFNGWFSSLGLRREASVQRPKSLKSNSVFDKRIFLLDSTMQI
nr:MAG TPA: hypothetical protein [Caudoviricetes sp.]